MKSLDCAINPLSHTFSGGASVSTRLLPLVCVKWRVFSKQQLILAKFNRPGYLKGVAGFKKQTKLYPYKCLSKSPTSSTFTFNGLSISNFKVITFSNEDIILALAGQFKQLSHEPEKFR